MAHRVNKRQLKRDETTFLHSSSSLHLTKLDESGKKTYFHKLQKLDFLAKIEQKPLPLQIRKLRNVFSWFLFSSSSPR